MKKIVGTYLVFASMLAVCVHAGVTRERLESIPVSLLQNKSVQERMTELFSEEGRAFAEHRSFLVEKITQEDGEFYMFAVIDYPMPSPGASNAIWFHFIVREHPDFPGLVSVSELKHGNWSPEVEDHEEL